MSSSDSDPARAFHTEHDTIADSAPDVLARSFPSETDEAGARRLVTRDATVQPRTSVFPPNTLRYVGGSIAGFLIGALITRGVLVVFDPSTTVALHQPVPPALNPIPEPAPAAPPVLESPSGTLVDSGPAPAPPAPRLPPVPAPASPDALENRAALPAIGPPAGPRIESTPMPAATTTVPPQVAVAPAPVVAAAAAPTPTPPPAAAPSAPPSAAAVAHGAVIATVQEYTQAYRAMDVAAAAVVWPSVDRRALGRAFATLKSQALELGECDVKIADASATVRCRGTVEYVRKIGEATPRTGRQDWVFKMRKLGDEWIIDALDATPVAATSSEIKRGA